MSTPHVHLWPNSRQARKGIQRGHPELTVEMSSMSFGCRADMLCGSGLLGDHPHSTQIPLPCRYLVQRQQTV
jgi:hypothetical protein